MTIIKPNTALARLTTDSIASDNKPTESVSHHACGHIAHVCHDRRLRVSNRVIREKGRARHGFDAARDEDATVRERHGDAVVIYPGAGHGFMRIGTESWHDEASPDAWNRMLALFAEHLH